MTVQYVQVDLGSPSGHLYTYVVDHPDPIQPGAQVEIDLRNGGTRLVDVKSSHTSPPGAYQGPFKQARRV